MVTVKIEFWDEREFRHYLLENTWLGAKSRVQEMNEEELNDLYTYLDSANMTLTETELNDFIWFEWEDIYEELKEGAE